MNYRVMVGAFVLIMSGMVFSVFSQADSSIAKDMVGKAAELVKKSGLDAGIKEINYPDGQFVKGEIYVFMYDTNAVMLAHPKNPKLIGKNLMEVPDVDGKLFRKEIIQVALTKKNGWVDYRYKNPLSNAIENKTTWVQRQGAAVICCGIYK